MYCRVPAYPRISLSPRFLLFFLLSSPLVLCIQRSPRVLYSSTSPPYFSIFQPQVQPSLCLSFLYGLPGHPCTYLLPSSLLKSLVLPMRTHIYSSSVLHPILVIFISHKFNPTSLRLAPYTFHCSIKRPTRICTRVYTMNSVVVQKANRIRVGHDTS